MYHTNQRTAMKRLQWVDKPQGQQNVLLGQQDNVAVVTGLDRHLMLQYVLLHLKDVSPETTHIMLVTSSHPIS